MTRFTDISFSSRVIPTDLCLATWTVDFPLIWTGKRLTSFKVSDVFLDHSALPPLAQTCQYRHISSLKLVPAAKFCQYIIAFVPLVPFQWYRDLVVLEGHSEAFGSAKQLLHRQIPPSQELLPNHAYAYHMIVKFQGVHVPVVSIPGGKDSENDKLKKCSKLPISVLYMCSTNYLASTRASHTCTVQKLYCLVARHRVLWNNKKTVLSATLRT